MQVVIFYMLAPDESRLINPATDLRLSRRMLSGRPKFESVGRIGNSSAPTDHVRMGGFGARGDGRISGLLGSPWPNWPWLFIG